MTNRGSVDILPSVVAPTTRKEELSHDPRGEGTRPAVAGHAPRPGVAQRQRCLPAAGDLAHAVLPLAAALSSLWRRRPDPAAATTSAAAAAGARRGRAGGAGVRPAV